MKIVFTNGLEYAEQEVYEEALGRKKVLLQNVSLFQSIKEIVNEIDFFVMFGLISLAPITVAALIQYVTKLSFLASLCCSVVFLLVCVISYEFYDTYKQKKSLERSIQLQSGMTPGQYKAALSLKTNRDCNEVDRNAFTKFGSIENMQELLSAKNGNIMVLDEEEYLFSELELVYETESGKAQTLSFHSCRHQYKEGEPMLVWDNGNLTLHSSLKFNENKEN